MVQDKPAVAAASAAVPTIDWKEFVSPDGRKYYYNKISKESRWTMPEEMKAAQPGKANASPAPVQVGHISSRRIDLISLKQHVQEQCAGAAAPLGRTIEIKTIDVLACFRAKSGHSILA